MDRWHYTLLLHLGTNTIAVVDSERTGIPSIFHVQCDVLVDASKTRCVPCTQQRKTLYVLTKRVSKIGDRTHPSSHAPYMSLTTPEKHQRLSRLHSVARNSTKQIERLRQKIATLIKTDEIEVEDELDNDVRENMRKMPWTLFQRDLFFVYSGRNSRRHQQ